MRPSIRLNRGRRQIAARQCYWVLALTAGLIKQTSAAQRSMPELLSSRWSLHERWSGSSVFFSFLSWSCPTIVFGRETLRKTVTTKSKSRTGHARRGSQWNEEPCKMPSWCGVGGSPLPSSVREVWCSDSEVMCCCLTSGKSNASNASIVPLRQAWQRMNHESSTPLKTHRQIKRKQTGSCNWFWSDVMSFLATFPEMDCDAVTCAVCVEIFRGPNQFRL